MNEDNFLRLFRGKLNRLKAGPDFNALEHLRSDNSKFSRLPDFPELARLRTLHPDLMYQKAVQLRVDRSELEEKILIPLRRALAAMFQFQSAASQGKSLVDDDDRPIEEVQEDAGAEMLAQLTILSANLIKYDIDPTEATGVDSILD